MRAERDAGHRVAGAGLPRRHRDLRQQLALLDGRDVDADEELVGGHGALTGGAADRERRPEGGEERRIVVGGIVDADVAADGAAVADLDVGDRRGDLGEDRPGHLDLGRRDHLRVRDHGAELERALVGRERDRAQLVEVREIDEHIGRGCPGLHHVDERLAPCEGTCPIVLGEESDCLLDGSRTRVLDLS